MTYGRHITALFLAPFAFVFLLVLVLLGLATLLTLSASHPYVSPMRLLAAIPDMLLLVLPIALSFAALVGHVVASYEIERHHGFLWIELVGRDPRRTQIPIVLFGVLLSLICAWLHTTVIPVVEFRLQRVVAEVDHEGLLVAMRALRDRNMLGGIRLEVEAVEDQSLRGVSVLLPGRQPTAIVARRGSFDLDARGLVRLLLEDGRLVRLVSAAKRVVTENLRFERFSIALDPEQIAGGSKAELKALKYYTNRELDRLPALAELRLRHGFAVGALPSRRLAAIPSAKLARFAAALTPAVFLTLSVIVLGRHLGARRGFASAVVLLVALGVLLPEQLVLYTRALKKGLTPEWLSFLPAFEAALFAVVAEVVLRRARR